MTKRATAKNLLNSQEEQWVIHRIQKAEEQTTGEIKVHLEDYCYCEVKNRAAELFAELHLHETHFRNGVLIYVAASNREFAVLGDISINEKTSELYWQDQVNVLQNYFSSGDYYEGICKVIRNVGIVLHDHFPVDLANPDEISNEISYGE